MVGSTWIGPSGTGTSNSLASMRVAPAHESSALFSRAIGGNLHWLGRASDRDVAGKFEMEGLSVRTCRKSQLLGREDRNRVLAESEHFSKELVSVARRWQRWTKVVHALETAKGNCDPNRPYSP